MTTKPSDHSDAYSARTPPANAFPIRSLAPPVSTGWVRDLAKWTITTIVAPLELKKLQRLISAGGPVKLHLGCADLYLDGWINIDLARPGRRVDLQWDLRRGLPLPDESVDAIFAEHLLEHIDLENGLRLLRECRRVLAPQGVIRLAVPDLGRYIQSYLGHDDLIDFARPKRLTRAVALSELFYEHGHRSAYDFETLDAQLKSAGFMYVERSNFGEGRLLPSPDSERRRSESLYVEAVK